MNGIHSWTCCGRTYAVGQPTCKSCGAPRVVAAAAVSAPTPSSGTPRASPVAKRARSGPTATEEAFRQKYLLNQRDVYYEGVRFVLPGLDRHVYTPDWVVPCWDASKGGLWGGRLVVFEVKPAPGKGGFRHPSYNRAQVAFDAARAAYPAVVFVWAERQADGTWKAR